MASTNPKPLPGRFGPYGGRYVPETLVPALDQLEKAYAWARTNSGFQRRFHELLRTFVGRPTPLTFAGKLSAQFGRRIWLKREDLCHTGAHKINNALGQALLAAKQGASGGGGDAMLPGPGLSDNALFPQLGCQQRLPEGVVDLVPTGWPSPPGKIV